MDLKDEERNKIYISISINKLSNFNLEKKKLKSFDFETCIQNFWNLKKFFIYFPFIKIKEIELSC